MTAALLRRVAGCALPDRVPPGLDAETRAAASAIVDAVRDGGETALLAYAERLDGWRRGSPWLYDRAALERSLQVLDREARACLERTAERIAAFAQGQRGALRDMELAVPGGRAGHRVTPVDRAGCYAPAGRFPLPSSLLMTAVTARAAGVREVIVASPRPGPLMLATAAIAGADALLAVGGAQAIAALAYGVGAGACDVVVGPGNRWLTAAKQRVAGEVAIDFLAGPSELVVVADATADPGVVAADLLAQAEHDPDALPVLVTAEAPVIDAVERELVRRLETLPTAQTARAALCNGFAVVCDDWSDVPAVCDRLAPEHLQLSVADPAALAARCRHAGAFFLGERSAEVFGDYGIGGNHVLPTGRGARFTGGLSALTFLRVQTWLELTQPAIAAGDVATLARLEGLEAHARAAECRLQD
ncbi:MAG TPA: histidinol dehydrogenase [Gemmatimonadales bacterium]|nr:histidinol dehydrogenase [Gemmatimonadales bacterium]